MSRYVDLHLHSTCSDGIHAPAEVVRMAAEAKLAAIALCDHDNVDGIPEAQAAGARLGVEVLTGVELSVVWEEFEDIHLLGYGFDPGYEPLLEALADFRIFRADRNRQIVQRVNEKLASERRSPIDFEDVRRAAGGTLGRPHIARALIDGGHVRSTDEAFQRYLRPCNVPKRFFPLSEAIALVHAAGGVTSLAHPPFISRDPRTLERLVRLFAGLGLEGIEAWNSGASNQEIDWAISLAHRLGLIVTGGSDYHGIEGGAVSPGSGRGNLRIPYDCVEGIRRRLALRAGTA